MKYFIAVRHVLVKNKIYWLFIYEKYYIYDFYKPDLSDKHFRLNHVLNKSEFSNFYEIVNTKNPKE